MAVISQRKANRTQKNIKQNPRFSFGKISKTKCVVVSGKVGENLRRMGLRGNKFLKKRVFFCGFLFKLQSSSRTLETSPCQFCLRKKYAVWNQCAYLLETEAMRALTQSLSVLMPAFRALHRFSMAQSRSFSKAAHMPRKCRYDHKVAVINKLEILLTTSIFLSGIGKE